MPVTTRDRLIQVASDLLNSDGLEAVTLRAVGARADVSRGAPYRHFADKEDLLAAVATAGLREILALVSQAAAEPESSRDRLEHFLTAYLRAALKRPVLYSLIFSPSLTSPKYTELHAAGGAAFAQFRVLLGDLLPARQLDEVAPVLWAVTHGAIMLTLTGHNETAKGMGSPEHVVRAAVALAIPYRARRPGRETGQLQ